MAEYVERKEAVKIANQYGCGNGTALGKHSGLADFIAYRIAKLPAADVAPVVHGRWIPCEPDSDVRFYCSECGTEISTSWDYDCDEMWNGCPHCLARMDGDGK